MNYHNPLNKVTVITGINKAITADADIKEMSSMAITRTHRLYRQGESRIYAYQGIFKKR